MSKFFRALEQAERERALRELGRHQETGPTEIAASMPLASRGTPHPAGTLVADGSPSTPSPVERPLEEGAPRSEPESRDGVEEHLVSLVAPASFEAEQYRALRHLVEQLHKSAALSVVAISSPAPGDGKTITAINLAGALAQGPETRVLLVDADLRRPSVASHLWLNDSGGRGLVDLILDPGFALEDLVRPRPPFNLSVLPAGKHPSALYELLKSPRLGDLLEGARRFYDYIVLDTPPLIAIPDCRVIERCVDGFLVVVAAHKTPRKLVGEALKVMDPAKIIGLVYNCDDSPLSGYYYNYRRPTDGDRRGWWAQVGKKVGRTFRRRRSSRSGRGGKSTARGRALGES